MEYRQLKYLLTLAETRNMTRAAEQLYISQSALSHYLKCVEERKAGNKEFLSAEKQIRRMLEENPLPELQYFLEHFAPAFELDLDELGTIED